MVLITSNELQSRIFTLGGLQVMLDRDLAELYKVEVKRLNEQVKRNQDRFPDNFRFQLSDDEKMNRSQFSTGLKKKTSILILHYKFVLLIIMIL